MLEAIYATEEYMSMEGVVYCMQVSMGVRSMSVTNLASVCHNNVIISMLRCM